MIDFRLKPVQEFQMCCPSCDQLIWSHSEGQGFHKGNFSLTRSGHPVSVIGEKITLEAPSFSDRFHAAAEIGVCPHCLNPYAFWWLLVLSEPVLRPAGSTLRGASLRPFESVAGDAVFAVQLAPGLSEPVAASMPTVAGKEYFRHPVTGGSMTGITFMGPLVVARASDQWLATYMEQKAKGIQDVFRPGCCSVPHSGCPQDIRPHQNAAPESENSSGVGSGGPEAQQGVVFA